MQVQAIKQEKEIKGTQIGKEDVKLSLFADNTILYTENHKDYTHTHTHREVINQFNKVRGYKVNTQESVCVAFL